jgi:hypothetical protein
MADATGRTEGHDDIYEPAFNEARDLFEAERAAILLFDDSDRMRFQAWRGLSTRIAPRSMAIHPGLRRSATRSRSWSTT